MVQVVVKSSLGEAIDPDVLESGSDDDAGMFTWEQCSLSSMDSSIERDCDPARIEELSNELEREIGEVRLREIVKILEHLLETSPSLSSDQKLNTRIHSILGDKIALLPLVREYLSLCIHTYGALA